MAAVTSEASAEDVSVRERVVAAVPTPFDDDGALDLAAFEELLIELSDRVDAVLLAGTTGEFLALEDSERIMLADIGARTLGADRVIVHIGHASTGQVVRLGQQIVDAGVHRLALLTPYYLPTDDAGVLDWFVRAAGAFGDQTLYPYLFPERTGITVDPTLAATILDATGAAGLKVSGAAAAQLTDFARACPAGAKLWSGSDGELVNVLAVGGTGVISGVSSVVPDLFDRLRRQVDAGTAAEAARAVSVLGRSVAHLKAGLRHRTGHPWRLRMSQPAIGAGDRAAIQAMVGAPRSS